MGLLSAIFGPPKCPYCGGPLEETSYAAPFPQWRCPNCIERNSEKRKVQNKIKALENRIRELENK
jgi:tRNA(Ile2) C34 agmatinyltransferase TiaS